MRIPQAQRRNFQSGVARISPEADLGSISAVGQPAQALASGLGALADTVQVVSRANDVEKAKSETLLGENLKNERALQYQNTFDELSRDPEVIKNPDLLADKWKEAQVKIDSDPRYSEVPEAVNQKLQLASSAASVRFNAATISKKRELHFDNTKSNLDGIQSGQELRALTTDDPIERIAGRYTLSLSEAQGLIPEDQLTRIQQGGMQGIAFSRFQRFLDRDDSAAAKDFLDRGDVQEWLGADGITRAKGALARSEKRKGESILTLKALRVNNPYKFVEKTGEDLPADIPFLDPNGIGDAVNQRIEYIEQTNKTVGVNLPFLQKHEEDAILKFYDEANPQQASQILNQTVGNVSAEGMRRMGEQIFQRNKSIGVALDVATDDMPLGTDILTGGRLRSDRSFPLPSEVEMQREISQRLQAAMPPGVARQAAIQGTMDLYASRVFKEKKATGVLESSLLEEELRRMVGPQIDFNGVRTLGFQVKTDTGVRWATEDEFEETVDGLTKETIQKIQKDVPRTVNGDELNIETLMDHATLRIVEEGKYMIDVYGEFAVDKNGKPFILDLGKLHQKGT